MRPVGQETTFAILLGQKSQNSDYPSLAYKKTAQHTKPRNLEHIFKSKRKSTETDSEMLKLLELAAKIFKVIITTILSKVKQNVLSKNKR